MNIVKYFFRAWSLREINKCILQGKGAIICVFDDYEILETKCFRRVDDVDAVRLLLRNFKAVYSVKRRTPAPPEAGDALLRTVTLLIKHDAFTEKLATFMEEWETNET